jgi:guanylate kinase
MPKTKDLGPKTLVMSKGRLVIVSGPSGAGKTSVMRRVYQTCRVPLVRSVSATTRSPRKEEIDGVDYRFISDDEFRLRRKGGEFLECFQVFNHGYWYGTLNSDVTTGLAAGKWVVLEIDVQGAQAVMPRFPDAVSIFLRPSSREELECRLRGRGTETEEAIQRRLARADGELSVAGRYQHQVINDDMDQAVHDICEILTSQWEKSRND